MAPPIPTGRAKRGCIGAAASGFKGGASVTPPAIAWIVEVAEEQKSFGSFLQKRTPFS
jgi:hypothetical protein